MELPDIDVIGLKPLQTSVDLAEQILLCQVVGGDMVVAPGQPALGGDYHLVPQAGVL